MEEHLSADLLPTQGRPGPGLPHSRQGPLAHRTLPTVDKSLLGCETDNNFAHNLPQMCLGSSLLHFSKVSLLIPVCLFQTSRFYS